MKTQVSPSRRFVCALAALATVTLLMPNTTPAADRMVLADHFTYQT